MPKEEIIIIIIISGQNVAIIKKGQAVVVPQNNTPHTQRKQLSPIEYDIPNTGVFIIHIWLTNGISFMQGSTHVVALPLPFYC